MFGLGSSLTTRQRSKGPFQSSSQTATCYYNHQFNHSKVEEIQLSVLPIARTQRANLPANLHTISFYVERQVGKHGSRPSNHVQIKIFSIITTKIQ